MWELSSPIACSLLEFYYYICLILKLSFLTFSSIFLYLFRSFMDTIWTPDWTGLGGYVNHNLRGLPFSQPKTGTLYPSPLRVGKISLLSSKPSNFVLLRELRGRMCGMVFPGHRRNTCIVDLEQLREVNCSYWTVRVTPSNPTLILPLLWT